MSKEFKKISVFGPELTNPVIAAVSGGPDSMAILDTLRRRKKLAAAAIFDHDTGLHNTAFKVVEEYCKKYSIILEIGKIQNKKFKGDSMESFWRKERYRYLFSVAEKYDTPEFKMSICTGHNLDDLVETWIFTSMNGGSRLIPLVNGRVIRPFMHNYKKDMLSVS